MKTSATTAATDRNIKIIDVTTNDVSTTKHGFAPKAPNDATKYLDGIGGYSTPPSGSVPNAYKVYLNTHFS